MANDYSIFSHERLDVFNVSIEFITSLSKLRITGPLKLQIERASESVALNIAEGASQRTPAMQKKHYRIALGSAAECAAALRICETKGLNTKYSTSLINRIGIMLYKLARQFQFFYLLIDK